jgi:FlaA1/EpsC-like NDP-sugar epimerase
MLKENKKQLAGLFQLLDVFLILIAFYTVYYLRHDTLGLNFIALPRQYQIFLPIYLIAWVYMSTCFRLYSSKRMTVFKSEALDIIKIVTICTIVGGAPAFFIRENPLSRIFLVSLWLMQNICLISLHYILREALKYIRRRGYNFRHILIVGRNERAAKLIGKIEESPELGFRILGFVDAANGNDRMS